ncbi:hypothetical protein EV184_104132 [Sinorhizobium americanum]|uniref:Uncharacterized protein n=1 Tax=Sinorhizobium americanum TaxID=194963 RepID=A0A4R2BXQ5_9HYPH|nr:hypothetical protein EV184_104132 [Sinorhizobium americanum]
MHEYTYNTLMANKKKRNEFLNQYGRLISYLKEYGYYEAAIAHTRNKERIKQELALL